MPRLTDFTFANDVLQHLHEKILDFLCGGVTTDAEIEANGRLDAGNLRIWDGNGQRCHGRLQSKWRTDNITGLDDAEYLI